MGTGTKLIAHEGMGSGMGIFLKRGYGDGHYGTLPNGYPLPSLDLSNTNSHFTIVSQIFELYPFRLYGQILTTEFTNEQKKLCYKI